MSNIILKRYYHTNTGYRLSSSKGILDYLASKCREVQPPSSGQRLLDKSECPGISVATLKPKFDCPRCYLTAEVYASTDTLILDIDEVPKTVSDVSNWLSQLLPPDVRALWYSTPRYRETAKRIRVVIRLSREISEAEKASLAHRLRIPGVDPASFQINKFSLLPCWTSDTVEFHWGQLGSRDLDVDADLPAYIPRRPVQYAKPSRIQSDPATVEALSKLVEAINDAPEGESYPVIKAGLSKVFRQFEVSYETCEELAYNIDREDRARNFLGLAEWLSRKYSNRGEIN